MASSLSRCAACSCSSSVVLLACLMRFVMLLADARLSLMLLLPGSVC